MLSEEFIQGLALYILSWYHYESDVYKSACHMTRMMYPQYADIACLDNISNEEVRREISTPVFYPDAEPPFPGIILVSGSSPAMSESMIERKDFFLERGFAVMILNSFTRARILEDCFKEDAPCSTFLELTKQYKNNSALLHFQCPTTEHLIIDSQQHLMTQNYLQRVTKGATMSPAERVHDLYEAMTILRRDKKVDSSNLALVGFSHGASVILEALTLTKNKIPPPGGQIFSPKEHSLEGIRAAVVFYPNCRPGTYFQRHAAIEYIDFQIHQANHDEYVRPELCYSVICRIDRNTEFKKLKIHYYDDKHAFDMKEYGDAYNEQSKHLAYQRTFEFIRLALDPKYQYECTVD